MAETRRRGEGHPAPAPRRLLPTEAKSTSKAKAAAALLSLMTALCTLCACTAQGTNAATQPSGVPTRAGTSPSARSAPADYIPTGRDVAAAGVVQHLTCAGAKDEPSSPTVVMIAGLGASSTDAWAGVFPTDAQDLSMRTCMVDRPGLGRSPDRPDGPDSPVINASEIRAALAAAGEQGPFIFAGWSYGGLVALLAAGQAHASDPASLAGLVLVDPTLPDEYRTIDPEGWEEAGQVLDMAAGESAATGVRLGDAPVVVLVAGDNALSRANWDFVLQGMRDVGSTSADYVVVDTPDASHDIAADDPAVILAALQTVAAAAHSSMPACPPAFHAADHDWSCLASDNEPGGSSATASPLPSAGEGS